MDRGSGEVGVAFADGNSIPLLLRAAEIDIGQGGAVLERPVADGGHACRNGDACEVRAVIECGIGDGGQTCRQHNAGHLAERERTLTEGGQRGGEGYACDGIAPVECLRADGTHTLGNHRGLELFAVLERLCTDGGEGVGERDAREIGAVIERHITNARDRNAVNIRRNIDGCGGSGTAGDDNVAAVIFVGHHPMCALCKDLRFCGELQLHSGYRQHAGSTRQEQCRRR